jgi:hypothetical protein
MTKLITVLIPTTPEIESTLAAMKAAEDAHGKLVSAKFRAIGKVVGSWAPELDNDTEITASYDRVTAAQRAYVRACNNARKASK